MKKSKLYILLVLSLAAVMLVLGACTSNATSTAVPSQPVTTNLPTNSTNQPSTTLPSTTTSSQPSTTTPPVSSSTGVGQAVTINLVAQNMAFDQSTITVPAGAKVTMVFNNKDNIPHNFALYTDSSAATVIFKGAVVSAKTVTYQFTAPSTPGSYFFRCDVHPTTMTGTFKVQ
jgi:plastocyanin